MSTIIHIWAKIIYSQANFPRQKQPCVLTCLMSFFIYYSCFLVSLPSIFPQINNFVLLFSCPYVLLNRFSFHLFFVSFNASLCFFSVLYSFIVLVPCIICCSFPVFCFLVSLFQESVFSGFHNKYLSTYKLNMSWQWISEKWVGAPINCSPFFAGCRHNAEQNLCSLLLTSYKWHNAQMQSI